MTAARLGPFCHCVSIRRRIRTARRSRRAVGRCIFVCGCDTGCRLRGRAGGRWRWSFRSRQGCGRRSGCWWPCCGYLHCGCCRPGGCESAWSRRFGVGVDDRLHWWCCRLRLCHWSVVTCPVANGKLTRSGGDAGLALSLKSLSLLKCGVRKVEASVDRYCRALL